MLGILPWPDWIVVMTDEISSEGAPDTSWGAMFRGVRGIQTILLNVGIGVHAIDIFVIATVMPVVVVDIGGVEFYAWTTMLYMVGTIVGAASGHYTRSVFGRRAGYVAGGIIFLAGAAGCAASLNMPTLLFFRLIEGLGGGLLMSQSMALINEFYPGRLRTRVLATVTTTWSIASVAGPVVGGVWGSLGWWRGAFATTCVLTLLFVVVAWRIVPEDKIGAKQRLQIRRLLLLAVSVMLVACAGQFEAVSVRILFLLSGVLLLWQTLRLDGRGQDRLFPGRALSLFAPVGTAYWVFLLLSASYTPLSMFLPLALNTLYGLDPLWIGYLATVFSLFWSVGSLSTAGWNDRWAKLACASGLTISGMAALALALTVGDIGLLGVVVLMAVAGLGTGMTNVHSISWTLAAADREEAGITASAAPAMRSIGIAYGAALAGLIANLAGLDAGTSRDAVQAVVPWVFGLGAVCALAGSLCVIRMYALKPGVRI